MKKVAILPPASGELEDAIYYYENEQFGLGLRFWQEVQSKALASLFKRLRPDGVLGLPGFNNSFLQLVANSSKTPERNSRIACENSLRLVFRLTRFMAAYKVEFEPGDSVNLLNLVYASDNLHSRDIEKALLAEIPKYKNKCESDILATAWYVPNAIDEELLPLPDGSRHLIYKRDQDAVFSWNEYIGDTKDIEETDDYYCIIESCKTFDGIKPEKSWFSISVLFKSKFSAVELYKVLLDIGKKWTVVDLEIHIYAYYGEQSNRASWKQVRDTDNKYVWLHYQPSKKVFMRGDTVFKETE